MSKPLRAPGGTSEVSVGTNIYPVDADGTIEATDEDAAVILSGPSGFTEVMPAAEPLPTDITTMTAPPGCTGASFAGIEFDVINGKVHVPVVAVNELVSHGFVADVVVPPLVLDAPPAE